MKNIKKFVGLLSLALVLGSCSDDDVNPNDVFASDLIGSWTLVTSIENSSVQQLDECDLLNTFTFTETTLEIQNYFLNDDSGECEDDGNNIVGYTVDGNDLQLFDLDDLENAIGVAEITLQNSIIQITSIEDDIESQNSYRKEE